MMEAIVPGSMANLSQMYKCLENLSRYLDQNWKQLIILLWNIINKHLMKIMKLLNLLKM